MFDLRRTGAAAPAAAGAAGLGSPLRRAGFLARFVPGLIAAVAALAAAGTCRAGSTPLVESDEAWWYHKGTNAPQALEVADEQHAKAGPRWNAGPSPFLGAGRTPFPGEVIEASLRQDLMELAVERVARTGDQFGGGDEEVVLLGFASSE
jgi:hypothetical protein